jgi:DNA-directed RNA polymerase specialized sigma subunit
MRTEKTAGYKERMRRGAELVAAMPELMTQKETAAALGISVQAVGQIERRALAKVRELLLCGQGKS